MRAVDHAALGALFQVAQLRRREISVENDQRRLVKLRFDLHFLDLAAPDHGGGIDLIAHLKNAAGNLRARAARQFREFLKRCALGFAGVDARHMRRPLQTHAHQKDAFAGFCRACRFHSVTFIR